MAAATVVLAMAVASAATAAPLAHAAGGCSIARNGEVLGPTYVETLTVSGTSCATGYRTIRDYNRCRLAHGGKKGRCAGVDGFRCTERRTSGPAEFLAQATCTRSRVRVVFRYSEFT
jgi:hypothetical protein